MVKIKNDWFPSTEPKKVKIRGETFEYIPVLAKERGDLINKYVEYDEDTGSTKTNKVELLRELFTRMIVKVPMSFSDAYKERYGQAWKGTVAQYEKLGCQYEDAIATALQSELGEITSDEKDF